MVEEAMPPERIAEIVVEAIGEGRFYIFPQPERKNDIRARFEGILEERVPVFPAPSPVQGTR
jgi:hypothetical protein